MGAKLPREVKTLLDAYVTSVDAQLPGFMTALYLQGSLALGAFQTGLSDIDFIAVISRPCGNADLASLAAIHQTLEQNYPGLPLSGSYLQAQDLGQSETSIAPHPRYHDGVLHPHGYHDINLVTWWLLKHQGIAVRGPDPQSLAFGVDWHSVVDEVRENLNTYWTRFTYVPGRMLWLLSDYGVQWTVLGVLRQYYTLKEQAITSKTDAGHYGLRQLPEQQHRIIQEAIRIREERGESLYRSRLLRAVDAFKLLRCVIKSAAD